MWLQVVHGNNLSNIVNGPRVAPAVVADRFAIDLQYRAKVPLRQLTLWARHPGGLTKHGEVADWRLRGTHDRSQGAPRTLSDRVREHAVRRGYHRRNR